MKSPRANIRCHIHFFSDKLAKHSWADCSKNPANQKKPAPLITVNTHHAVVDNRYLSNDSHSQMELDHMEAADDQTLDRCLSSNYNNAFATFKAPPSPAHKKMSGKVRYNNMSAKNKRRTIASSNKDGKDIAYTQSVLALAKGLKESLLFTLESN
jgi:hypothetical protein